MPPRIRAMFDVYRAGFLRRSVALIVLLSLISTAGAFFQESLLGWPYTLWYVAAFVWILFILVLLVALMRYEFSGKKVSVTGTTLALAVAVGFFSLVGTCVVNVSTFLSGSLMPGLP